MSEKKQKGLKEALNQAEMKAEMIAGALEKDLVQKSIFDSNPELDTIFGYHQALSEWNFVSKHMDNLNMMMQSNNQQIGQNNMMIQRESEAYKKDMNVARQTRINKFKEHNQKLQESNEGLQTDLNVLMPLFAEVHNDVWNGVIDKYGLDEESFHRFKVQLIRQEPEEDGQGNQDKTK